MAATTRNATISWVDLICSVGDLEVAGMTAQPAVLADPAGAPSR